MSSSGASEKAAAKRTLLAAGTAITATSTAATAAEIARHIPQQGRNKTGRP